MNNEKRSLLAISLSALIFVVYYAFFFLLENILQKRFRIARSQVKGLGLHHVLQIGVTERCLL